MNTVLGVPPNLAKMLLMPLAQPAWCGDAADAGRTKRVKSPKVVVLPSEIFFCFLELPLDIHPLGPRIRRKKTREKKKNLPPSGAPLEISITEVPSSNLT